MVTDAVKKMRFCIDCKWARADMPSFDPDLLRCHRPGNIAGEKINPVSGRMVTVYAGSQFCANQRARP